MSDNGSNSAVNVACDTHRLPKNSVPSCQLSDPEESCRLINKKACDEVLPYVLRLVVKYGCKKEKGCSFEDYLKLKHKGTAKYTKYMKRFNNDHLPKLKEIETQEFDSTFLFKLIPEVCDKFESPSSAGNAYEDDKRIEYYFKRIQGIRNDVMHNLVKSISPEPMKEIEEFLPKMVDVIADLYSIDIEDKDKERKHVESMLRICREVVMTDAEKKHLRILLLLSESRETELKTSWEKFYNAEHLPFFQINVAHHDLFHCMSISFQVSDGTSVNVPCQKIFENDCNVKDYLRIIIIEGVAGSGKSTLLRHIGHDFLRCSNETSPKIFTGIGQYEFMLYFECRESSLRDLNQLIRKYIPNTLRYVGSEDALQALPDLKVLILVDAVDEWNDLSKKIVIEIFELFRLSVKATIIITSRSHAVEDILGIVGNEKHVCQRYAMKEIASQDEQIEFITRYQKNVFPHSGTNKLVDSFKSLDEGVRLQLAHPVHLVMFGYLYSTMSPTDNFNKWNNQNDIMNTYLQRCKEIMIKRIKDKNMVVNNVDILIRKLLKLLCELSHRCLKDNHLFVCQKKYESFQDCCYETPLGKLPIDEVVSCVLSEKTCHLSGEVTHHYFHKGFQEYLSALAIKEQIENGGSGAQSFEPWKDQPFIKRNPNLFNFLLVELCNISDQTVRNTIVKEICTGLQKSNSIDFKYWAKVLRCSKLHSTLLYEVKHVIPKKEWCVDHQSLISAIPLIKEKNCHPKKLVLDMATSMLGETSELLKTMLHLVKRLYRGTLKLYLWKSFVKYEPCDDLLQELAGAECGLRVFTGCINSSAAAATLAALSSSSTTPSSSSIPSSNIKLHISLQQPLQLQYLRKLQHFSLFLTIRYNKMNESSNSSSNSSSNNSIISSSVKPLTKQEDEAPDATESCTPPYLCIEEVPQEEGPWVAAVVEAVSTALTHKYESIYLQRCRLADAGVRQVVQQLHLAGVRTAGIQLSGTGVESVPWEVRSLLHSDGSRCTSSGQHQDGSRCLELMLN